ncbi:MAG: DUF3429 domain-containing protein [Ramlibacter sp.]
MAWLGYGGLVPFVALAIAIWVLPSDVAQLQVALRAYGAVILSFVGALHWAFAMTLPGLSPVQRCAAFAWSTIPALLAWSALLLPIHAAAGVLLAGFVLHWLLDRRMASRETLPQWYLPLRTRLTVVACACLVLGALH